MGWVSKIGNGLLVFNYHAQFDAHVIRFRAYQRAYMEREYRHAGERF